MPFKRGRAILGWARPGFLVNLGNLANPGFGRGRSAFRLNRRVPHARRGTLSFVRIQGILDYSSDLGIPVNLGRLGRLCIGRVDTFEFGLRPSVVFRVRNSSIGGLSGSVFVHWRILGSGSVHSKAKTRSGCPKPDPSFPEWMKLEPMLAWPAKTRTLDAVDSENGTLEGSGAGEAGMWTLGSPRQIA